MKISSLRRTMAAVAVATMGIVGVSGDLVLAAPGGIQTRTTGGGSTGEARYTSGTGLIRVRVTCNSNNTTQYGPWRGINVWSASNCGPQGFYGLGYQTA